MVKAVMFMSGMLDFLWQMIQMLSYALMAVTYVGCIVLVLVTIFSFVMDGIRRIFNEKRL